MEITAAVVREKFGAFTIDRLELTDPRPDEALCDGPNSLPLKHIGGLLETLVELDRLTKRSGLLERQLTS